MIKEACLPWMPLPERFRGDWQVDVVHLAESYSADLRPFENLSIAVAAYSESAATLLREEAAWRLDFRRCEAYRKRIIQYAGRARSLVLMDRRHFGRLLLHAIWSRVGYALHIQGRSSTTT